MTPYINRLVAVLWCAVLGVLAAPATSGKTITVTIDSGPVTGTYTDTIVDAAAADDDAYANTTAAVARFLGIRFGEPPLRFAPAQPAKPWSSPLDASAFGSTCLQQFNYPADARERSIRWFSTPSFPGSESEDCLFINVVAPGSALSESGAASAQLKAVMVWIYGGSFQIGSGALPVYDGTQFAAKQDVLVVTFNYRLGVFGFPGSPQIAEQEQNLGMLDQRLALDWVQRNIAAFGGDPRRVTIFGESAGAGSVDVLLTAPPAGATLPFAAAIMQSGQGTAGVAASKSKDSWSKLARALGCPDGSGSDSGSGFGFGSSGNGFGFGIGSGYHDDDDDVNNNNDGLACMRNLSATQLRDAAEQNSLSFFPIHDGGATWSDHPRQDRQASRVARVPILIGTNANEGGTMVYGKLDIKAFLQSKFPPNTPFSFIDTMLTGPLPDGSPGLLDTNGRAARILTEYSFQCPSAIITQDSSAVGIPAWRYFYNASFPNTDIYPGSGAYHSSEISTLFGTFPSQGATPFQRQLHQAMQSAWAAFAKNPSQGPGWDSAPDALALLGGGASSGSDDLGRQTISVVSPADIDRRCPLYNVPYALES
ncbi:hypothetical protein E4U55_002416 [Claviceps digitariae]|nr:hypothetical protein E4U55_002416 [Claviceps digitariae]